MLCIQCAMKALLEGKPPPQFDETVEEHMRKHHPDPEATKKERELCLKYIAEKFKEKEEKL